METITDLIKEPTAWLIDDILQNKQADLSPNYAVILNDPVLSRQAIDNFIREHTRQDLTEQEQRNGYVANDLQANGTLRVLAKLKAATAAKKAQQIRVDKAARAQIDRWHTGLPGEHRDFNAPGVLWLNKVKTKQHDTDTLGRAAELLAEDPVLLEAVRQGYQESLLAEALVTTLSKAERQKIEQQADPRHAPLQFDLNSVQVYRDIFAHWNLTEAVEDALYARYRAALELVPGNTPERIEERMQQIIRPRTPEGQLTKYILSASRSIAAGVSDDRLVAFERVLAVTNLRDQQRSGSGRTLDKIRVLLDDHSEADWYALSLWYAGGDDADDHVLLYDDQSAATAAYQEYN